MNADYLLILVILFATVGLFLWGRWRHDMVAVSSLIACVFTGLVPIAITLTAGALASMLLRTVPPRAQLGANQEPS